MQGQRDPVSPHIWERGKEKCCGFLELWRLSEHPFSSGRNPSLIDPFRITAPHPAS